MIEARTPVRVCRLQLDERVAADLDVRQRRLSLIVLDGEPVSEAHLLRVELVGVVEVLDGDRHVVHVVDAGEPRVLREAGADRRPDGKTRHEHEYSAHVQLL
jgi:hypothetical protein